MNDLRKAAEMALEALVWTTGSGDFGEGGQAREGALKCLFPAIQALRQALNVDAVNMSQERVDETAKGEHDSLGSEWVECVKLPIVVHVRKQRDGETHISTREGITPVLSDDLIMRGVAGEEYPIGRELFERTYTFDTAPPKREWVGLTDEERKQIVYTYMRDPFDCLHMIEAKLKEKNNG